MSWVSKKNRSAVASLRDSRSRPPRNPLFFEPTLRHQTSGKNTNIIYYLDAGVCGGYSAALRHPSFLTITDCSTSGISAESVGVSVGGSAALIFQGSIRRCAPMGYARLIGTAYGRAYSMRATPANIYVYGVGAGAPSLGLRRSTARSAHFTMGLCPYTPRAKKTAPSGGSFKVGNNQGHVLQVDSPQIRVESR